MVPDDLRYTAEHEWVRGEPDGTFHVGITDFAQEALGDIVYVSLPEPGTQLAPGAALGEVESTKSVSEVYAPFAGEVVAINDALSSRPELLNSDPYGEGWIAVLRAADGADAADGLLGPDDYRSRLTDA